MHASKQSLQQFLSGPGISTRGRLSSYSVGQINNHRSWVASDASGFKKIIEMKIDQLMKQPGSLSFGLML